MNPYKTYSPDFSIKVSGTDLRHGVTVDVLSVSVTDTANQADSFSITLRDRNPTSGRFAGGATLKWIDSGLFDEGGEVEIGMGYVNNLGFVFGGDITAVSASFPESGVPTLTVRGFSRYHRLQRQRRPKPFESKTVSGIAEEIAHAMKLTPKVDAVRIRRPYDVKGEGQTYAEILKQRAEPIHYEVAVKFDGFMGHTLFFQKPRYFVERSPVMELQWGRDLRSFSPSLSTYDMITGVKVLASQTSRGGGKEPLKSTATAGMVRGKMGGTSGPQIAQRLYKEKWELDTAPMLYENHDIENQEEANEVALAQLEAKALDFITGQGSVIGTPDLKARILVKLTGLGQRFSGLYYVTSATHTIDASGYRTDFEVKRNAR